LFSLGLLGLTWATAEAENWPGFRGPTGQGISTEAGLPVEWNATTGVGWKTPIPGEGWSSPIVWGERIFLTAALQDGRKCHVLCLDADSGRILWNTEVLEQVPGYKEGKNSYATPTPCTDGERVYAVFSDGSIAALDFAGGVLWTNREVSFYSRHGLGASPLLYDGLLIMPYDGSMRVAQAGKYPNNTDEERTGWLYQERLGGKYCASPVYADGRIYFLSEDGETVVLAAGAEFKILARNPLNERCQASLAVSGGRLFIRTDKHLYCLQ
jgi:outer membrane protein assembly factor BamB